ncbi:Nuclear speckle RNA-binding protein A [Zea mays]|uniref:Nuclear speckle RNA-binding protein A n=1 Tax=Zea mays TaxID=4577 RepID=A0A1D6QMQ8_MAIZE|nr:Nuclear speckle RNA-binding protein A [Zea mays]
MMGVVGMDSRGMGYGGRPEPPLPPDASSTLYIEGLPANCTRREVSHIFRPFVGFREVRLVNKESRHPGGDPHVLCFVDFDNPAQATIALEALQGVISLTNTSVIQPICVCNSHAFPVQGQLVGLAVGVKTCGPRGCRTYRLYERSNYGGLTLRYALNFGAVAF